MSIGEIHPYPKLDYAAAAALSTRSLSSGDKQS